MAQFQADGMSYPGSNATLYHGSNPLYSDTTQGFVGQSLPFAPFPLGGYPMDNSNVPNMIQPILQINTANLSGRYPNPINANFQPGFHTLNQYGGQDMAQQPGQAPFIPLDNGHGAINQQPLYSTPLPNTMFNPIPQFYINPAVLNPAPGFNGFGVPENNQNSGSQDIMDTSYPSRQFNNTQMNNELCPARPSGSLYGNNAVWIPPSANASNYSQGHSLNIQSQPPGPSGSLHGNSGQWIPHRTNASNDLQYSLNTHAQPAANVRDQPPADNSLVRYGNAPIWTPPNSGASNLPQDGSISLNRQIDNRSAPMSYSLVRFVIEGGQAGSGQSQPQVMASPWQLVPSALTPRNEAMLIPPDGSQEFSLNIQAPPSNSSRSLHGNGQISVLPSPSALNSSQGDSSVSLNGSIGDFYAMRLGSVVFVRGGGQGGSDNLDGYAYGGGQGGNDTSDSDDYACDGRMGEVDSLDGYACGGGQGRGNNLDGYACGGGQGTSRQPEQVIDRHLQF